MWTPNNILIKSRLTFSFCAIKNNNSAIKTVSKRGKIKVSIKNVSYSVLAKTKTRGSSRWRASIANAWKLNSI